MELLLGVAGVIAMMSLASMPWTILVQGGAILAALGLLVGLPTGIAYHVKLRRELERCGFAVAGWWLHPTSHHGYLDEAGRRAIGPMYRWGGTGCGVVFLGCFVAVIGILRSGSP